jgi:hypothetical protein
MSLPELGRPLTIDYTDRDFESLRVALVERIRNRIPEWRGDNPSDFGLALVESFAHVGDVVNYYIDRVANEGSIFTAIQRQSLLNLARSYGYIPSGFSAANITLRIAPRPGITEELTVPEGSVFSLRVVDRDVTDYLYFTTTGSAILNASGSELPFADVAAINARPVTVDFPADPENPNDIDGEELTSGSSGTPNQVYALSKDRVVTDSIDVYVQNGERYGRWNQVENISDAGPTDPVFEVQITADNQTLIIFGDGVAGAIPAIYEGIKVQYFYGGGSQGNVPVTTPFTQLTTYYIPELDVEETAAISGAVTISAITAGVGGSDPDSDDVIRGIAPSVLLTSGRAISLEDFTGIALRTRNVFRAAAQSDIWTSVNVYVAPVRTTTVTDPFPLFDEENNELTVEWDFLESSVLSSFEGKTQIGTTVTVLPPQYTPINVSIKFTAREGVEPSTIIGSIKDSLLANLGYNQLNFGDQIYPEGIESVLFSIPGVFTAKVTELYREGSSPGRFALLGGVGEFFTLQEANINVTQSSNQTAISGFIFDEVYGLYPEFSPDFFDYSLTIFAEDDELEVDIVGLPATATATISGEQYSGAPVPIGTTNDVTEIPVVITAEDGITTRTYTITAIKES